MDHKAALGANTIETPNPPATVARNPSLDEAVGQESRTGFTGRFLDLLEDQRQLVSSPAHIRFSDATWLVPLGGITAGLFVTDRQYSASLSQNPATIRHYKTFSNVGIASLVGTGAGMYLFSYPTHNEHWRETGFLAGEAALNSLITTEALKYSLRRERPYQGTGAGRFFGGGTSFPSEHAAAAWSIAGVIAHEYPGPLPGAFAYGMASAISFSRIHARQHFPSDVLIGSALGYLISQSVYKRHHDPELRGGAWESPSEFVREPKTRTPSFMGSPYVPLDSWIYPAIAKLAALGYVKSDSLGLRPWTRLECARLLSEVAESLSPETGAADVENLYRQLSDEFAYEFQIMNGDANVHGQVESIYARALGVSGTPLTDNEHFGQTFLNDYGRPYQEGFNSIFGTSGWTAAGPFIFYANGEFQSAPSAPAPSAAAQSFIAFADSLPPNAPLTPVAAIGRLRLLDAYVGVNLGNWGISYGRQSLWWGSSEGGAMLFTNNAEPINMFRITRVSPFRLPSALGFFGDIRMEFFLGRLSGHEFINNGEGEGISNSGLQGHYGQNLNPQPFLSGARISFKFTPNFEFNMAKTTIYGGPGNPLTPKTLVKSTLALHQGNSPIGDGRSGIDFSYRLPKLRDWLSVYGDSFQEDEISPFNRPYKAAFQAGLYLARVPKLPKLDFRLEGGTTSPINFPSCADCYYGNPQYLNGYTNNGKLIGTWIGRASQGELLRTTYWLAPQRKISLELRQRVIDRQYLSQGGTQRDAALSGDFLVKAGFRLSGTLQYERWQIPLLAASRQSNVLASLQVSYWPKVRARSLQ